MFADLTFTSEYEMISPVRALYREFGRLVRERRKATSMSQATLAGHVGLSRTSITNIELGRQHLSLHMLFVFAKVLGVEPKMFLPDKKFLRGGKVLRFDSKHVSPKIAQDLKGLYERVAPKKSEDEGEQNASHERS